MVTELAAKGYRAIAMDHVGFGMSDKPVSLDYHSFENHVARFVAFMDALEDLLYETALEPSYPDRRLDYVVYSHEIILEAVRSGNADEAASRMRAHLHTFRPNAWRGDETTGAKAPRDQAAQAQARREPTRRSP